MWKQAPDNDIGKNSFNYYQVKFSLTSVIGSGFLYFITSDSYKVGTRSVFNLVGKFNLFLENYLDNVSLMSYSLQKTAFCSCKLL